MPTSWRKLYWEGRLGISIATPLLPVQVKTERPTKTLQNEGPKLASGTMEIKFLRGTLRIAGSVDVLTLRAEGSSPYSKFPISAAGSDGRRNTWLQSTRRSLES
jgi:hypothetical protein